MVWSQVCGPTGSSCVLGSSGVSVALFCRLSLWSHPLLMLFLAWVFFLWRLFGLGLVGCVPAWVPAFFWGNSFPCSGFRLAVPAVWLSRLRESSWTLCFGSFPSLPVFAVSWGWLWVVLDCSPLLAWRRRLLPWFSVRYLSACPRGAGVPLGSSVLRQGSPVSGRDCVFPQFAIMMKAFPPSGGFGSWPSCGVPCLRLALCSSAFVVPGGCPSFSGWSCSFTLGSSSLAPVSVGGFNHFPSPLYSFEMWSPFGSIVSFCHS